MFDYMGDNEIICKAIEKAIPKKPLTVFADSITPEGSIVGRTALVCPSCNSFLVERQNYCTKCRQVLDWKEIKGDY